MSAENKKARLINIPPFLECFYEMETASGVIREMAHFLRDSDETEQEVIIKHPLFGVLMKDALNGLDQRRERGINRLLDSVTSSNVQTLKESLGLKEDF